MRMQQPLLNSSNSSPKNSINYQTTSTDSIWDRLAKSRLEDIPLNDYKELKSVTGFKKSSSDSSDRIKHAPDIYKGSKKGENDRYIKIKKHVTEQYTKLKTFLENHIEEEYEYLAERIDWHEYITQMTDFYANQGLLHNDASTKKSVIKWVTGLGKVSQFDEVIFCAFNLQESVQGMGGAWYLWLAFLIPTLLQIIPNALSIQPADEAKEIIDPDYTKFKVTVPKNLEHVKFLHHVLDILEENNQNQLCYAKPRKYLLTALSGLASASATYLISDRYFGVEDQTKYILTASSGLLFPVLTHTGMLGKGITFTNAVLTVGTFLITNMWGSAAQGVPIFTLLKTFLPTNLAALIPTGMLTYLFFLGIGFTYYILQAGRDTWDSALTYFSQKNPMVRVFLISFFSGMEIFVQYAINSVRRGISMSGIVTAIFNSFNPQCYPKCPKDLIASPTQKLMETIAFIAGTDSTAKSRNSGAKYFLKPFTFDLFGQKDFVLADNKLLDFDNAKSKVSLTRKEILKTLGYSSTFALALGAGTGLGAALFTDKLWSIIISALSGAATAGLSKFYSLRTELINTKARTHIDSLCGNEESNVYEPRVKWLNFSTLTADNGMRVLSIAGMGAAVSIFSGYDQNILYYALLCGSVLPVISEWDFLSPKSLKGNQELVDGAREAVGSHMYLMSELPDEKELDKYKNTFILIKQAEHKHDQKGTITAYFINDEAKQEVLTPAKQKQVNTVTYAVERITDQNENKPIYDRSGNNPKQVQELYQVLNKIKSSPQDLESKGTEPADEKEENDDEQPQGKCSRACDCLSLAMSRLTVRIFGSVKPQSLPKAEEEEEEEPSSTCLIS